MVAFVVAAGRGLGRRLPLVPRRPEPRRRRRAPRAPRAASARVRPAPSRALEPSPSAVPGCGTRPTPARSRPPRSASPSTSTRAARPAPIALPPVVDFTMATLQPARQLAHHAGRRQRPAWPRGRSGWAGPCRSSPSTRSRSSASRSSSPTSAPPSAPAPGAGRCTPGSSMGRRAGENSVAWRYRHLGDGQARAGPDPVLQRPIRPMPYVLLRHKETGVQAYFSTFHNPADIGAQPAALTATRPRDAEIKLFNQLEATGHPAVRHR